MLAHSSKLQQLLTLSGSSGVLAQVLHAMLCRYIRFPHKRDALNVTKYNFYTVAGFLKVIGAIHWTNVQHAQAWVQESQAQVFFKHRL